MIIIVTLKRYNVYFSNKLIACLNRNSISSSLSSLSSLHCLATLSRNLKGTIRKFQLIDSFIHSGHFYSAPSSPLLYRGTPDYSTDTVSEFHAEAHRQLQVKDLPKVPTWRPERE